MGRTVKGDRTPPVKPVQRIELNESHSRRRFILVAVLVALALICFAVALVRLLSTDPGWKEIGVTGTEQGSCAGEFVLMYYLGDAGISASVEYKQIAALYTEAAATAGRLFDALREYDGCINVAYLNRHINETVEVDGALYRAFSLFADRDSRALYLAPLYLYYQNLFFCTGDEQIADFDPLLNPEVAAYFAQVLGYTNDPAAVELQLLGDNRVCLFVSEEYRDYAEENGIDTFVDFFWMKNAFLADYLAKALTDGGYTAGTLSSYDGFSRTLGPQGQSYTFPLYDRVGGRVYQVASAEYTGQMSTVYYRAYMLRALDEQHYYVLENGEVRTPYIDPSDGLCKSPVSGFAVYGEEESCAQLLLLSMPLYVADTWDTAALSALTAAGVGYVFCGEDKTIRYSGDSLRFSQIYDAGDLRYTLVREDRNRP